MLIRAIRVRRTASIIILIVLVAVLSGCDVASDAERAIDARLHEKYTKCGDSWVTRGSTWEYATAQYTELSDPNFTIEQVIVSDADRRNGIEFAGKIQFSDKASYRIYLAGPMSRGWTDWKQPKGWFGAMHKEGLVKKHGVWIFNEDGYLRNDLEKPTCNEVPS